MTNGTIGRTRRLPRIDTRFICPIKKMMTGKIPILAQILGEIYVL
jgi:hypothetical protein